MAKPEKVARVAELRGRIEGSAGLLMTEYRGLTVGEMTELRRTLSEGGARFSVVKNTLMRRAANDAALGELTIMLEGPTAVAFIVGDPVGAAKNIVDAQKRFPSLLLKGGYVEGRVLSAEQARALADLESREVMRAKAAGLMKAETTRAASMFQSLQARFLGLVDALRAKTPEGTTIEGEAEQEAAKEPSGQDQGGGQEEERVRQEG